MHAPPTHSGADPNIEDRLLRLPPFRPVAGKVLLVDAESPDAVGQMVRLIRSDPAFSSEVLHFANSAYFGFPSAVQTLDHAAALIGATGLIKIAVRVAMQAFLGSQGRDPLLRRYWLHSLVSAEIAEMLAPLGAIGKSQAYMAALLHDLGRLGLLKACGSQYRALLDHEYHDIEESMLAEEEAFQRDHCAIGGALVRAWNLPHQFAEVNERHHQRTPLGLDLPGVTGISCRVATWLGYGSIDVKAQPAYTELLSPFPGPVRNHLEGGEAELRAEIDRRVRRLAE